uniref:Uncharacterized protein n=1 Tax=Anguilla anguilla TaxID=7936 RepID=A0A0E9P6A5_ANGAN
MSISKMYMDHFSVYDAYGPASKTNMWTNILFWFFNEGQCF